MGMPPLYGLPLSLVGYPWEGSVTSVTLVNCHIR